MSEGRHRGPAPTSDLPEPGQLQTITARPPSSDYPTFPEIEAVEDRNNRASLLPPRAMEKEAKRPPADRLPKEIIEQILFNANPNGFTSLILLSRDWWQASQNVKLYARQLSHCPFYGRKKSTILAAAAANDLDTLRRMFNSEVKRNLFNAYLRPRETIVKLISTSVSSSSSFPGGEAFYFSFSPNGRLVLATSSSRIYVVDTTGPELRVVRELKILRRPVAVAILDDVSVLAVLSTDHQVNIYDLRSKAKHVRLVQLDNPPRTIALSPGGSVLAAAYDGGIEVYSLSPNALSTDRRAVKCDAVDSLSFSADGTMLLGTTLNSPTPNTVVLSAPYYHEGDEDIPASELLSQMWTTQILFPNNSRDCSHATLLPRSADADSGWTFTQDRVFETFRAVRLDDLRNGTMYFTGPFSVQTNDVYSLPSTIPTSDAHGRVVASGFAGKEIWLYGLPEDLEYAPEPNPASGIASESSTLSPSSSIRRERRNGGPTPPNQNSSRDSVPRLPQWQVLCDKFKNVFIQGQHIASVEGIIALQWVNRLGGQQPDRLVAVALGVVSASSPDGGETDALPVDGGRIVVYDFVRGTTDGEKREVVIELGDNEPELLEEQRRDLEAEVAIVRRRTVAQNRSALGRSREERTGLTRDPARPLDGTPPLPRLVTGQSSAGRPAARYARESSNEDLEGPYTQGSPRSHAVLRAATIASHAASRQRRSFVAANYTRGPRDPPHESDADNWVPPPPPYTAEPDGPPLPEHLQRMLLPSRAESLRRLIGQGIIPSLPRAQTDYPTSNYAQPQRPNIEALGRTMTTYESRNSFSGRDRPGSLRQTRSSDSDTLSRSSFSAVRTDDSLPSIGIIRASTMPMANETDDLYDASPPASPVQTAGEQTAPPSAEPDAVAMSPTVLPPMSATSPTLPVLPQTLPIVHEIERGHLSDGEMAMPIPSAAPQAPVEAQPVVEPEAVAISDAIEAPVVTEPLQEEATESRVSSVHSVDTPVEEISLPDESALASEPSPPNETQMAPNRNDPLLDPHNPRRSTHETVDNSPPLPPVPAAAHQIRRKPTAAAAAALTTQSLEASRNSNFIPLANHHEEGISAMRGPGPGSSRSRSVSPPTPTENRRPSDLTAAPLQSASASGQLHQPVPTHAQTAPDDLNPVTPSPELLANLQARYSQLLPPARPLSTHDTASSRQVPQQYYPPPTTTSTPPRPLSQSRTPVSLYDPQAGYTNPAPPAWAVGAAGHSPSSPSQSSPRRMSRRGTVSPRGNRSPGNRSPATRSPSSSTPNLLRPDLQRLDTIHSVRSNHMGENTGRPMTVAGTQVHREKVYLANTEAEKKGGWGLLRKKTKKGEGRRRVGSNAAGQGIDGGWEEVTRAWEKENGRGRRKYKGSKCVVM
ncbi:MAG: hypothetical protein M1814_006497 [Vezdaea aestivalis]|nr:MAG: hypothetical protein M1814_006497 [Vezdaea aestivalis]